MNRDERIDQIEWEIRELAAAQTASQQKLQQLFTELQAIRRANMTGPADLSPLPATGGKQPAGELAATSRDQRPGAVAGRTDQIRPGLEHFIGLRLIHLVGIIVLLTGISIGIKYAIDKDLISPLARIGLAYGAGMVLFLLSLQLRKKYNFFSAILFSGSMACCYFTTYGALAYYAFISSGLAFVIMLGLTVFTVIQSIRYNRIEIALIGLVGAYGVPLLVSSNTGRVDLFFAFIFLINSAVVFLAYRKDWQLVSRVALLLSFALLLGWLALDYNPSRQNLALITTVSFHLLFLADAFCRSLLRRSQTSYGEALQAALVCGLLYLALILVFNRMPGHYALVTGWTFVYLILLTALVYQYRHAGPEFRKLLLLESITLLVLYIQFRWDGITVTLGWLALCIGLFVSGVVAREAWLRITSAILVAITLLKLITIDAIRLTTGQRILSFILIGVLLLVGSFYYQRFNINRNADQSGK